MKPLILLMGPSGCGKSTVARELIKRYGLSQVDSYTTREPRIEDEPGHTFISYETYLSYMMDNKLVAYTQVDNNFYGADKDQVDAAEIYVIDPFGAKILAEKYKTDRDIFFIFLDVAKETRLARMQARGSAREVDGRKTFDESASALAHEVGKLYPYCLFIDNNDLNTTVNSVANFVGLKER